MKIRLHVRSGGKHIRSYSLGPGEYSVGSASCDILLSYPTVSRWHGSLTISDGGAAYVDAGSRNGSAMDNPECGLRPNVSTPWPADRRLAIGPFVLGWDLESARAPRELARSLTHYSAAYGRLLSQSPDAAWDLLAEQVGPLVDSAAILERIRQEFHGNGPLREHLADPECREILINSHDQIYVDRGEGPVPAAEVFLSRETYEAWAVRTVHTAGRRLDPQHPICEATLPCGARLHAVLPPISSAGLSVAIRRFVSAPMTETAAVERGWIEPGALRAIREAIDWRRNIVISGGTSTGKTSLLNFLCQYLPPHERVITVEDTIELSPPLRNVVQLQARTANSDGIGLVGLRQLVQCALRMRPDRIIVGECRGGEVLEMLQAMNTGHPGSITTVHANSCDEALQRLELLALLGATNLSLECIRKWIHGSIDMVLQLERSPAGHRHLVEIIHKTDGRYERVYRREHGA